MIVANEIPMRSMQDQEIPCRDVRARSEGAVEGFISGRAKHRVLINLARATGAEQWKMGACK